MALSIWSLTPAGSRSANCWFHDSTADRARSNISGRESIRRSASRAADGAIRISPATVPAIPALYMIRIARFRASPGFMYRRGMNPFESRDRGIHQVCDSAPYDEGEQNGSEEIEREDRDDDSGGRQRRAVI